MEEITFPHISEEFLNAFKKKFPYELPNLAPGERLDNYGLGKLYGFREITQTLEAEYAEQQLQLQEAQEERKKNKQKK